MSDPPPPSGTSWIGDYHRRTSHRFEAYAKGPEALDWDAQPAPFRHFAQAPVIALPRLGQDAGDSVLAKALSRPFGSAAMNNAVPADLAALGALLQLSLGITAWKFLGPNRWAVRANPSSGNLHPLEAYVVVIGWPGLADGVHHYRPEHHALELRARFGPGKHGPRRLMIGLTSVMWREAWKYGERAFRYCQLDAGHGIAAIAYAASVLGWSLREEAHVGHATLARLLGTDRIGDFPARRRPATELEEPEGLFAVLVPGDQLPSLEGAVLRAWAGAAEWSGPASPIDPFPFHDWGVVTEAATATRRGDGHPREPLPVESRPVKSISSASFWGPSIAEVILNRRSAQRFDPGHVMKRADFEGILLATLPSGGPPWGVLMAAGRLQLLLYVHRVEGLVPGLYFLQRVDVVGESLLRAREQPAVEVVGEYPGFSLWRLLECDPVQLRRVARSLHCHQDIAATSCFAVGMVTDLNEVLTADPAAYRDLHREAGLIGQVLYLQAGARGLQGTGIGCFFDEPVRDVAGLEGSGWRSLYHFTVGRGVPDPRIETGPPYP